MKIFKILNKILIGLVILLILGLLILAFISNKDNKNNPKIDNTTTTTKKENILPENEIIDLLKIYKDDKHEFIIKDQTNDIYQVERKNLDTGNVDMIYEVNSITGDVKIIDVKSERRVSGGGSEQ